LKVKKQIKKREKRPLQLSSIKSLPFMGGDLHRHQMKEDGFTHPAEPSTH